MHYQYFKASNQIVRDLCHKVLYHFNAYAFRYSRVREMVMESFKKTLFKYSILRDLVEKKGLTRITKPRKLQGFVSIRESKALTPIRGINFYW